MKKRILQILQIAVTVAVMVWLFHDPQKRAEMGGAIRLADWHWLLAALAAGVVAEMVGVFRWRLFLRVQEMHFRLRDLTRWFFIGLFFNMVLPGTTGGDLARLYYVCRELPAKRSAALLTLLIDRLTGSFVLILITAVTSLISYRWLTQTVPTSGLLFSVLGICGVLGLMIGGSFVISGARLAEKLPVRMPGREMMIRMSETWQLFARDPRCLVQAMVLSAVGLLAYYGVFYCAGRALHAGLGMGPLFSIMPVVTVLSSVPVSVGGLGLREGLFERLLGDLCGTAPEMASLISLLGYSVFLVLGLAGGVLYLIALRLDRKPAENAD